MFEVPKNYNNGRKRKGVSRPNFSLLRSSEQSISKERNLNGIKFSDGTYTNNEFGLQRSLNNVHSSGTEIFKPKYALLHVRNKTTDEYFHQPYSIRDCGTVNTVGGKLFLDYTPVVNHKKLKKEISKDVSNYEFYLTDLGRFKSFIEYGFYDLELYNNDTSDKKYNRNINYSKMFKFDTKTFENDIAYKVMTIVNQITAENEELSSCGSSINYKDITLPVIVSIGDKSVKLDAFNIYYGNTYTALKPLVETNKKVVIVNVENVKEYFNRTIYIILNKTQGKIQYVPETRFTNLADFVVNKGSYELKRSFNRGDTFEVLQYVCNDKKEYSKLAFSSKFAKTYRKIDLKKNQFDITNLTNMYDDYCKSVNENYDQKMFIKNDINIHLNVVYSHINNYTKKIKQETAQEITCPVQMLILNAFSEACFKQAWHNNLFHEIVTDQKVFLKKAGLNEVLREFSLHGIRMNEETQRRVDLLTESLLLLDTKAGIAEFTSINNRFYRGANPPPMKDREVAPFAGVNIGSHVDIPSTSAVNDSGSYAQISDDSDYLDALMVYANEYDYSDDYIPERWTV